MRKVPETYDEFIAEIMSMQHPTTPAYKTEKECREWMEKSYPGLKENFVEMKAAGIFGQE